MLPDDLWSLFAPAGGPGILWSAAEPILVMVVPLIAVASLAVIEFVNPE